MSASTLTLAPPLLFKWLSSYGLDRNGALWALHGRSQVTGTFDRGGTAGAASSVDANGRVYIPGYKRPRLWHNPSSPTTGQLMLLEGSRANVYQQSESIDNAYYTKTRSSITADATTAPDGTTTADKLVEDTSATTTHYLRRATPTLTDNTSSTFSFFAKAGERTWVVAHTFDKAATDRYSYVNVSTGVSGTTDAGHTIRITPFGNGWYRIACTFNAASGASSPLTDILTANADGGASYTGDGTSGLYVWGLMFETDKSFPSSYIPTTSAAVTRSADSLSFPFYTTPRAMTVYWKGVEGGSITSGTNGVVFIVGGTGAANPMFYVAENGAGKYNVVHHNGTASVLKAAAAAPSIGDTLELRAVLQSDGSVLLGQSISSGTEAVTAASSANTLNSAWASSVITAIGASATGWHADQSLKVASGVQTLATMRAL